MSSHKSDTIKTAAIILLLVFSALLLFRGKDRSSEISKLKNRNDSLHRLIELSKATSKELEYNIDSIRAELTPDTVYKVIKTKYDEKIDSVSNLDGDGQLEFLSKWLSESDY